MQKIGGILRILHDSQNNVSFCSAGDFFLLPNVQGIMNVNLLVIPWTEGLVIPKTFNETNNTSAFFTSLTALGTLCDFFLGQVKCVRERYPISMVGSVKLHICVSFFP